MPFKPLLRAFPSVLVRDSKGMLLRDYFASDIANGYVRFMGCDPDARGQICDLQNADNNAKTCNAPKRNNAKTQNTKNAKRTKRTTQNAKRKTLQRAI